MTLSRQELKIPVVIAGLDAGKRNVKSKRLGDKIYDGES